MVDITFNISGSITIEGYAENVSATWGNGYFVDQGGAVVSTDNVEGEITYDVIDVPGASTRYNITTDNIETPYSLEVLTPNLIELVDVHTVKFTGNGVGELAVHSPGKSSIKLSRIGSDGGVNSIASVTAFSDANSLGAHVDSVFVNKHTLLDAMTSTEQDTALKYSMLTIPEVNDTANPQAGTNPDFIFAEYDISFIPCNHTGLKATLVSPRHILGGHTSLLNRTFVFTDGIGNFQTATCVQQEAAMPGNTGINGYVGYLDTEITIANPIQVMQAGYKDDRLTAFGDDSKVAIPAIAFLSHDRNNDVSRSVQFNVAVTIPEAIPRVGISGSDHSTIPYANLYASYYGGISGDSDSPFCYPINGKFVLDLTLVNYGGGGNIISDLIPEIETAMNNLATAQSDPHAGDYVLRVADLTDFTYYGAGDNAPPVVGTLLAARDSSTQFTISQEGTWSGESFVLLERSDDNIHWETVSYNATFPYVDSGLVADQEYYYRATSYDTTRNNATCEVLYTDTIDTEAPVFTDTAHSVIVQADKTSAMVLFNAATDNVGIDHYEWLVSYTSPTSNFSVVNPNIPGSGIYSGLVANQPNVYSKIRAYDAAGNYADSSVVSTNTLDTTDPVSGTVTLSNVTTSSITVSYAGESDNVGVTRYVAERSTDQANWTSIYDQASWSDILDAGRSADTTYYYRVTIYDAAGNSHVSATASATTSAAGGLFYDGLTPDYYVAPYTSVSGASSDEDEAADGATAYAFATSEETPCTFKEALENCQPGDIIGIAEGAYTLPNQISTPKANAAFRPNQGGTLGNSIVFVAKYPAAHNELNRSILQHTGDGTSDSEQGTVFGAYGQDYLTWIGFYVDEANAYPARDTGPCVLWNTTGSQILKCVLDGVTTTLGSWGDEPSGGIYENHNGIRIEGAIDCVVKDNKIDGFKNSADTHNGAGIMSYSSIDQDTSGCIIEHNEITNCGSGMYIKGEPANVQSGFRIRYNKVSGFTSVGIELGGATGLDNQCYQNLIDGENGVNSGFVFGRNGIANWVIQNNVITNVYDGFYVTGRATTSYVNNVCYNNIVYDVTDTVGRLVVWENDAINAANSYSDMTLDYNVYYESTGTNWFIGAGNETSLFAYQTALTGEPNSVTGDPDFTDSANGDYTLGVASSAANAGYDQLNLSGSGVGSAIDCGLYISGSEEIGVEAA